MADRIDLVEPFRRRSLQRAEIRGRRMLPSGQGFPIYVLVSRDARLGKLKIPMVLKSDEAFVRWFYDLVDLDKSEALESKNELEETFRSELPPEERSRQVALLRRVGVGFNAATLVLLGASFVLANPEVWLLAIVAA